MLNYLQRHARRRPETGASAVEYGLLVAAIAAVIVAIVFTLGSTVKSKFSKTNSCISGGASATSC